MTLKFCFTTCAAIHLAGFCLAERLEVTLVPDAIVKGRLEAGAVKPQQRQPLIRSLFEDAGCPVQEQSIDKHTANVLCTLPGKSSSVIMVGGHFDFAEHGKGIVDDWSGTSLLPSIYQALKDIPRHHTFVFSAFANEEHGLIGSSHFVKNLNHDQRSLTKAFLNLECLGLTPPKVWMSRSDPQLLSYLKAIAKTLDVPLMGMNVDQVGDDDSHPFLRAKIPVLTIHSLTQETLPVLHSERDQISAVHLDYYLSAYKLVAYYLAYLDAKLD